MYSNFCVKIATQIVNWVATRSNCMGINYYNIIFNVYNVLNFI